MWKNILQPDMPQLTIWRTRIACWIPKDSDTHSEYVMFIAIAPQQRLHERVSMLRYAYIAACLVYSSTCNVVDF